MTDRELYSGTTTFSLKIGRFLKYNKEGIDSIYYEKANQKDRKIKDVNIGQKYVNIGLFAEPGQRPICLVLSPTM